MAYALSVASGLVAGENAMRRQDVEEVEALTIEWKFVQRGIDEGSLIDAR